MRVAGARIGAAATEAAVRWGEGASAARVRPTAGRCHRRGECCTQRDDGQCAVQPSGAQLRQIGRLLEAGRVRPSVDRVFPLAEARQAYELARAGHPRGKIVLTTR
jgi:NADPH:quinone reductase-like Zn-dependent oxidoreductase